MTPTTVESPAFPATGLLFRDDAYRNEAEGIVIGVHDGFLVLDQTLFYPASGGQPSDAGTISLAGAAPLALAELRYLDPAKTIVGHRLAGPGGQPQPAEAAGIGARVGMSLDNARRLRLMRMHSALHLLSVEKALFLGRHF